ncbi:IPT/TIG domain protein [Collimonas arenae]|nr:IPT/TIG domain protein [Collimonas arenae]
MAAIWCRPGLSSSPVAYRRIRELCARPDATLSSVYRIMYRGLQGICLTLVFTMPVHAAQYVYDELGRLVQVVSSDGTGAQYVYDAVGNITTIKKNAAAAITIAEFAPSVGPVATTVTIYGSGFLAVPANNTVTFNGAPATITAASPTSLTVTVPLGATTGKIAVSNVNGSATSAVDFTVGAMQAPTITNFSPTIGAVGTAVTITGTNFQTTKEDNKITFGNTAALTASATANSLATIVSNPGGSGKIGVTTPYGKATSNGDFYALPTGVNSADIQYTGRLLVDGAIQTVTINTAGKKALLLFDGLPQQYLSLVSSAGTFVYGAQMMVYTPDGKALKSLYVGNDGSITLDALPKIGTYSILLSTESNDKGKVNLQLKTAANGALIIDGEPFKVVLSSGQNGRYTFNGSMGQSLGLGYTGVKTNPLGKPIYYTLYQPDGTQFFSDYWSNDSSNKLPVLPVSGSYTLGVSTQSSASANVALTLSSQIIGVLVADAAPITFKTTRVGQSGRYTFSGVAGQQYWMDFSNGTMYPTAINVYAPDGTNLASNSVGSSTTFDIPALPVTGTYSVVLSPSGATTGQVDLQLKSVPANKAGVIAVDGAPLQVDLIVHQKGVVTFNGTAGQALGLGYTGVSTNPIGQSIAYMVYKPDGSLLFSDNWSSNNKNTLPILPVTGAYTITIQANSNASASVTLTLSSELTGTLVADATPVTFKTVRVGQNGRYTFSGMAGQRYWMVFSSGTLPSAGINVYAPDGTYLTSNSVSGSTTFDIPTLPVTGTYSVAISPSGATIGQVDLELKSVPADKTGVIAIDGVPLQVDLATHQKSVITFSGNAGQVLGLGYSGVSTNPSGQSITYTVYKPDGSQLFSDYWSNDNSNNLPILPVTGTYTINIQLSGLASASVTLTLSAQISGTLVADAAAVTFKTTRVGQGGRYTFSGVAGQQYWMVFSNGTMSSAGINVYAPDGTNLTSNTVYDSATFDIPVLPMTGTYSVVINPSSAATGQVDMQLKSVPADKAGVITVDGAPLQVELAIHQKGVVTFNGTVGQTLQLKYTGVSTNPIGRSITYTVYKPDGSQLFSDYWSNDNSNNLPALPVTGVYTINVQPSANAAASVGLTLSSNLASP